MISTRSTTLEHITNLGKTKFKKKDLQLIEKVIYALILLEHLAINHLDFIFKGGTSLILILNRVSRFSIDIDLIVPPNRKGDIPSILDKIIQSTQFSKWEEQKRQDKGVPKQHFKLFYQPGAAPLAEQYVLLDVLYEEHKYPTVETKEIISDVLITENPAVTVQVPCANSILGDKLTAYAPNTTGIPYGVEKELEIIKQLFDIGNLFDRLSSVESVSRAFHELAKIELSYRGLEQTPKEVLYDVFHTSLTLCGRGKINSDQFKELEIGIRALKGFVIDQNFTIDHAIICASKSAYLATILIAASNLVEKYRPQDLTDMKITSQTSGWLNKLSKSNPEAFFYWYHAFKLISPGDLSLVE